MPETVVIVGAGVTGLSTAYHLARRGRHRIVVVDKGPVGDGSSSRAAAIITGLLWSETGVRARKIALDRYRELSSELDGYRFRDVGCLNLFDPESWPAREALLPIYDRCEAPYEILDAAAMRRRWPDLRPPDDFLGLYDPRGGYSEPDEYLPALRAKCLALGVEIREREPVGEILVRGGQAAGVRTASGEIEADAVVATVYAWTNRILETVGIRLPVKAFVHQRYVTSPLPAPLAIPAVNANPMCGYVRPAAGGRLLLGIETPDRDEERVDSQSFHMAALEAPAALKDRLRANFRDYIPALGGLEWEAEKVGLLTFASDGEPILGPVSRLPGLFIGVAFHSGGFAYNPASGLLLAEFVADGKPQLDLAAFSPDRFSDGETAEYLAETVKQRDVVRRRH